MTPLLLHPAAARTATDAQLVAAVRAGARGAFEAIHDRYRAPLLGYARQVLGGAHHDAEEVVQDAFIHALRSLQHHPDRDIALKAWLYTIVRNAATDRLRRPSRTVDLAALSPVLSDRAADPHEALARREALADVLAQVAALPARQRTALVEHELGGRSHAALAASLGVSVGATKALVHRARASLHAA